MLPFPALLLTKAALPIAILSQPVLGALNALMAPVPIATFLEARLLERANIPIATLQLAAPLLSLRAAVPNAILSAPVVLRHKVLVPSAMLPPPVVLLNKL